MSTKILIAEDDVISRKMLVGILNDSGYEVIPTSDGAEAWQILSEDNAPRLAILDWGMPGLEGVEVCRRLRQLQTLTPCYLILITARSTKADIVSGLQAGANDFICKPFDRNELLARIQVGCTVTQLQADVQALARRDSLTQTLNRHALTEEAEREWSRSVRCNSQLSCVMFDIDYFKKINDVHGHMVGDTVIAGVAKVLREGSRASDVMARYGGEEFCALLPDTNETEAVAWGERMRIRIADLQFSGGSETFHVTSSFGAAERLENMTDPKSLIDEADQSLLFAKQSDRNRGVAASLLTGVGNDSYPDAKCMGIPEHISAAEIMTPVAATLRGQASLFEAAQFLLHLRLDSAPVVDQQGHFIDFISEEELFRRLCSGANWQTRLADCVHSKPASFDVRSSASAVFKFLMRVSMRRIVIVDAEKPVGVISRATLLRWLCNRAQEQQQLLAAHAEAHQLSTTGHNHEALSQLLKQLHAQINKLSCKLDENAPLEPHNFLIAATQMQSLCEDILACGSRSSEANSPHASLFACLE